MSKDANAIFRSQVGGNMLERLSAVETLKGLKNRETIPLVQLIGYLEERGLWTQFAKITLGDLRGAFTVSAPTPRNGAKKRKKRILEDELSDVEVPTGEETAAPTAEVASKPDPTGGLSGDEFSRMVLPFVEGNGDVTLDDIEDYSQIDRKVIRHHLGVLVKEGRLERIGVGKHAIYSAP